MSTTGDLGVRSALDAVPLDDVMSQLKLIVRHDRYQASDGIMAAAHLVAECAEQAGLSDVGVRTRTADGRPQWWSFDAPASWTPLSARMDVTSEGARILSVDHGEHPFAVGTHSASVGPGNGTMRLARFPPRGAEGFPPGALAVVDASDFHGGAVLAALTGAGARGLVTDAPSKGEEGREHRGRIELPPDSGLFAFSLTPDAYRKVAEAVPRGAEAAVAIEVGRTAPMPVVTACLPGTTAEEVWVTAHLCHPRPGANDNASGVAASLGVASALARRRRADPSPGPRSTIRFVWAPEFVGTAAMLDVCLNEASGVRLPEYVINLDMVGEDQELCRSPFVVERPPDLYPSLLTPLTEHVVSEVFRATSSHPGVWRPSPFLGFSDHALFADPSVARPAVQFCHPEDRFNHSAGDDVDKVSPVEMLRSTGAATALCDLLARERAERPSLVGIVEDWCERELVDARRTARRYGAAWGRALSRYVDRHNAAVRALAGGRAPTREEPDAAGEAWHRSWEGPLNLRAMIAALPPSRRQAVRELVARDKNTLSVLFNLAIRADGTRDRAGIIDETSYALRRPLPRAPELFQVLESSGWISADPGGASGGHGRGHRRPAAPPGAGGGAVS
ncbi:DUF4910 domain-containing protein [Nocardiopsis sp. NPDC101807]|uniref:DUF4910 domain-containing protein n=1 Tax=Nocardiopsis sp. NPDC101807 TaxID=3364339 RepID=UPI0038169C1E